MIGRRGMRAGTPALQEVRRPESFRGGEGMRAGMPALRRWLRDVFRGTAAESLVPGAVWTVAALGLATLGAAMTPGRAQNPGPKPPPEAEKIGEGRYRLGKAIVDLKGKTLTCSGKINMQRSTVEYLAVAPGGKQHESVLVVDVRPLHLQLGLILLGLEPKGGLRYQGDTRVPRGSPVELYVSWRRNGRTVKVPAEELVWDIGKKRPMERHAWVFSGSAVKDGQFLADQELSLVGTYRDPLAIINNVLPTGADDTVYKVNERIVPPVGTPVTFTATPGGSTQ